MDGGELRRAGGAGPGRRRQGIRWSRSQPRTGGAALGGASPCAGGGGFCRVGRCRSRRRQGRGRGGAKGPREIRRRRVDAPRRGPCCHHGSTRESAGITGDHGCHHGSAGRGRRRWLPWRMERYATICCCLTL